MLDPTAASPTNQTLRLPDGRALGYAEYGRAEGQPLFYFHGHPGARLEAKFLAEAAALAGVRLIGVDRPGLGLSTYQPHRRMIDWPADVCAVADYLRFDRFAVVGLSAGGPYALACAHQFPQRLTACGVVSGAGRVGFFLAFLAQWVPWLLLPITRRFFQDERQAQQMLGRAAQNWVVPDQQSLRQSGIQALMATSLVEALRPGAPGAAYDGSLLGRPWGFQLADVKFSNIHLWHGELDQEVPVASARAVAEQLPQCQATYYPNEGHISLIVNRAAAIVNALI